MSMTIRCSRIVRVVRGFCNAAAPHAHAHAATSTKTRARRSPSPIQSDYLQAAAAALQTHLCNRQGMSAENAHFIAANSPDFLKKLVSLGMQEHSEGVDGSSKLSVSPSCFEAVLEKQGMAEAEVFVRSMGGSWDGSRREMGSGHLGLLAKISVCESFGISRRKLWKMFAEEEEKLIGLTLAELLRCFVLLDHLGVDKKLFLTLLRDCPPLRQFDLDKDLKLRLELLQEWGIQDQVIKYFVRSRPQDLSKLLEVDLIKFKALVSCFGLPDIQIGQIVRAYPPVLIDLAEEYLEANAKIFRELDLKDDDLAKILVQCPRLLVCRKENYLKLNVSYLANMGLEPKSIARFILRNASLMCEKVENTLEPKIKFFSSLGLERKHFKKFMTSYFSLAQCSLDNNLVPKLVFLEELGMDKSSVAELFIRYPSLLGYSLEQTWKPKFQFLQDLGIERNKIGRLILKFPAFITCSIEHNLKPKMIFLKSIGYRPEEISKVVFMRPTLLSSSTQNLTEKVHFLSKLGVEAGTPQSARALGSLFTMSYDLLNSRVDYLVSLGFSHNDVCAMVKKIPTILNLRHDHLGEKTDYLINTMHVSLETIRKYPQFLTYSLEQRSKPRHRLLMWLQAQGLLKQEFNFIKAYHLTEVQFMKKYVHAYVGALHVYKSDSKA